LTNSYKAKNIISIMRVKTIIVKSWKWRIKSKTGELEFSNILNIHVLLFNKDKTLW